MSRLGTRFGGANRKIYRLSRGAGRELIITGLQGQALPKEYIEGGQIYFGFEVDEKLLPFAIEEFGDQCWVYGSDIPHGDRLYGSVDVFLKRDDISEESKRSCSLITQRGFTVCKVGNVIVQGSINRKLNALG
jgi:hypothetical protein